MDQSRPVHMSDDERDTFLGTGGTGVISFSSAPGDPPHSIPVSYGYDATATGFVRARHREAGPGRRPGDVRHAPRHRRRLAQCRRPRHPRVHRRGAISTDALAGMRRVDIPLVDVFERPLRELSFQFYRLRPDDVHGRTESRT